MRIDSDRNMADRPRRRNGFLKRLRADMKGNTLAIVGAALVPLTAIIGSGVDMSRAYMAKTRLQSACDAAALAARRVMTSDQMNNTVRDEGRRFFNFNFAQGLYGTAPFTPTFTRPSAGTVRVDATTTIPTTVMRLFGFTTLPLNVNCDASLNFVNTDILLVLDTTGSMLEDINGNYTSAVADQKIFALRQAVLALYDELRPVQTQLEANGMRLRYGIVPYSATVNVGSLIRQANPSFMANDVEYQTRVAVFNDPVYTPNPGTPQAPVTQVYPGSISQNNCDKYGRNISFNGFNRSPDEGGGPEPAPTWSRTFSNNEARGVDWGWSGSDTSGNTRSCRRRYVQIDTTYETEYEFSEWSYEAESIDVSAFNNPANDVAYATNTAGRMPVAGRYDMLELAADGTGFSTTTSDWDGCIMERETVPTIDASSGYAIPGGARDLDVDLIPTDDDTRWRAYWPQISYYRTAYNALNPSATSTGHPVTDLAAYQQTACPTAARRLAAWSRGNIEAYLQTLDPDGYTYHDIGMLWGARLISSGGIFADSPTVWNGMPVQRHLIFMTDGVLNTYNTVYGAYGIEGLDRRVTGTSGFSDLTERHRQRFRMICNQVKGMNVSIWVVAFASTLEPSLVDCASNPGQASLSSNQAELIAQFRQIGTNIGALRLVE